MDFHHGGKCYHEQNKNKGWVCNCELCPECLHPKHEKGKCDVIVEKVIGLTCCCGVETPADLKPAEPTIKCLFFKNGKCIKPLDPTAECNNCGKPARTCALTCDCEEETCNIGIVAEPQAKMPLTNEEEILYDAILSARKVQEFLWGENNSDWDIDEWRAMFQKRWVKIASIEPANPHGIIELKKRLLQNAALCLALLSILEQKKPVKTTNLPQYRGVKYDI
jgi:hypothetical protein